MKTYLSILAIMLSAQMTLAQYQIGLVPRVSPDKSVYQKVGYTEVEVKYGSPAVNQRQIFGAQVSYDKVWRAGANNATTVAFSDEVRINGMPIDSGSYALFMIPKENEAWTVIFNKVHKQWGAFRYNEAEDALRVDVMPRKTPQLTERLSYTIDQVDDQHGSIILAWENIEIEIPFETNYLKSFMKEVETRASKQKEYTKWVVYLQGAEYLEKINSQLVVANDWIDRAERIMGSTTDWNENFYPRDYIKGHVYWIKAKLLARENNLKGATEYVGKLKALENPTFYEKENEDEGIDAILKTWNEK